MSISKNGILTGAVNLLLGGLIAAGPATIFPVCEAMGNGFMKCHWTAQAEIGCGAVIALLGILLLFTNRQVRIGLQAALVLLHLQAILIPDLLIGVCGSDHMRCHSLTLPALNVLGALGLVAGIINLVYLLFSKNKDKSEEQSPHVS